MRAARRFERMHSRAASKKAGKCVSIHFAQYSQCSHGPQISYGGSSSFIPSKGSSFRVLQIDVLEEPCLSLA